MTERLLEELRGRPAGDIVVQAAAVLITAAQAKLGRADARVCIDVLAGLVEAARGRVEEALTAQLDAALNNLRLAQVDAETRLAATPAGPGTGQGGGQERPGGSGRLWVPPSARR